VDKGLAAAPQSEAAQVACAMLAAGGNAFDAAIAGALAQGVVDPHRSGIGGFGAAILYAAREGKVESVTFFGRAGLKARNDLWADILIGPAPDGFGYILTTKENDVGYRSITVPGMTAGIAAIHGRYGKLPWRDLFAGPAALARRGFVVGPQLANFWRRPGLFGRVATRDRLGHTAEGARLWLPNGEPPKAGDIVKQEALAATYDRLAEGGPEEFYRGAIGAAISADWEANGALVTRADLESYAVRWQAPVEGEFAGRRILSTPLPGGGPALLQCLAAAAFQGVAGAGLNRAEYVDQLGRIFSAVQHDRTSFHADPEFEPVDVARLLSPEYIVAMLDARERRAAAEGQDTTVIVTADRWGNACAFCHSLGYGSGVFTPGLGFMYNNCMQGYDPVPGTPNSIVPGKARSTGIAQTIVMEGERPALIIGSPGGSHITAGLAQVLINRLVFGMDLQDAVCRPRFDAYRSTLLLEARMPFTLEDYLAKSWKILRSPNPFGMVGRIYGIAFTEKGLVPGYDPGEPGVACEP